jgi:uncharacterized protein YijF (DUF1287 family)
MAMAQTGKPVRYDGAYRRIPYPGGDVPPDLGVCTDVVIRAYRAIGFDFEVRVHEDMRRRFSACPKSWGLSRPLVDHNIGRGAEIEDIHFRFPITRHYRFGEPPLPTGQAFDAGW